MPSGLPHVLELCQPNLSLLVLSTDARTHACTHPPQCMHTCGDSCVIVQQKSGGWFRVLNQSLCCSKVVTLTVRCPFTKSTHSVQFSSVQLLSCVRLSNCLRPHGLQHTSFPVHRQLPELTQTHVHHVGDAIQPFHPLSSPSPTFNLSQHQGLFK